MKLVLKRIKWEKVTSEAAEKGRKKNKRKGMEKEKRSSAELLSLSHSFNKTFVKFKNPTAFYL